MSTYKNFARIGWRARIGVLTPATGIGVTSDFHKIAPEGVAMMLASLAEPVTQMSVDQLASIGDHVASGSRKFVAAKASAIILSTTSGSLIRGYGYDRELIEKIESSTHIPATNGSSAMVKAFNKLGIRKLCLATPYVDEINRREKQFLEDNGFEVLRYKGLQILNTADAIDVAPSTMYELAKDVDVPEAEAIFISCAGLGVIDILEMLETDLGKPVMSTNQVCFWEAFRLAKIGEPIQGYGRLLRERRQLGS